MPIEWIVPAVAVLLVVWGMVTRGRLITLRQAAEVAWTETDEKLRRRHDRVSRLADAVGGRMPREKKLLDAILAARRVAASQQEPQTIGKAEGALSLAIARFFEKVDENSEVRADPGLQRLRADFSALESEIGRSARAFNDAARAYNDTRMGFHGTLLGYIARFEVLPYYATVEAKPPAGQSTAVTRLRA